MEQASLQVNQNVQRQVKRFLITGVSAVCVDTLIYLILVTFYTTSLAKGISFISGTIVAYFLNKFWTFEKKSYSTKEIFKFLGLYTFTLGVNVCVNELILIHVVSSIIGAFIIATGGSTILNFIGQKWWVFKS